jgi:hypothetical protein
MDNDGALISASWCNQTFQGREQHMFHNVFEGYLSFDDGVPQSVPVTLQSVAMAFPFS